MIDSCNIDIRIRSVWYHKDIIKSERSVEEIRVKKEEKNGIRNL